VPPIASYLILNYFLLNPGGEVLSARMMRYLRLIGAQWVPSELGNDWQTETGWDVGREDCRCGGHDLCS
jgi:hypothetical protein